MAASGHYRHFIHVGPNGANEMVSGYCHWKPPNLMRSMASTYLSEFQGTYLEDSYLLGILAEGCDLRLKMLFVLTIDHPAYEKPKAGEAHCYREGYILIRRPTAIKMKPGRPAILTDPDGSLDFGSIELYQQDSSVFRVVTEWFEASFTTETIGVHLA